MRARPSRLLPFVAVFALGLAGCSTSTMSRIDSNRAVYETWPLEMKEAVLSGTAVKGMTPDMVEMALGKPTRVETRSGSNADDEVWVYSKGSGLNLPRPNVSLGGSIGGVGVSSGGGGGRTPTNADEKQVVFQKGVVTRVD